MSESDVSKEKAYQNVFFDSQYGCDVLLDLLNECNYFATDADAVKPELTSLANRILNNLGVYDRGLGLLRCIEQIKESIRRK